MPKVEAATWVEIGPCKVICADWHGLDLPHFDAVVSDPPYGISMKCGSLSRGSAGLGCAPARAYHNVLGDDRPFDPAPLLNLGRPTVLWGANHYASKLPDKSGWLVWDKMRPDDLDQATCELAWSNCVKGVRRIRHLWHGCFKASQRGEGWHPTEKPVAVMEWILCLRWCLGFRVILDPYMGSGTTGVACLRQGRGFVGVEKDPVHFNTACGRLMSEWRGISGGNVPKGAVEHVGEEG